MCSDGYYQTVDVVGRARFELTFVNHIPNLHFDLVTCTYRSRRVGGRGGRREEGAKGEGLHGGVYVRWSVQSSKQTAHTSQQHCSRQHTQPNSTAADSINHISVAHT